MTRLAEEQDENKRQSKGGRPKKVICRSAVLAVRMTATERMIIESKAGAAGMKTAEWFRRAASSAAVAPRFGPEEMGWMRSLAGACNNLNQLVKLAYKVGLLSLSSDAHRLLNGISLLIEKLNKDDRQTD